AARKARERQASPPAPADALGEGTGRELLTALDEELQRLPERYRAPPVFCYLERNSQDQAARQLISSLTTLKRQLRRAYAPPHARRGPPRDGPPGGARGGRRGAGPQCCPPRADPPARAGGAGRRGGGGGARGPGLGGGGPPGHRRDVGAVPAGAQARDCLPPP